MIRVRKANIADLSRIVMFAGRMHPETTWADIPFSASAMRKNLRKVFRDRDIEIFIAENRDGLQGFVVGVVDQLLISKQTYATDVIFIARLGGKELFTTLRGWAKARGAAKLLMSTTDTYRLKAKERWFRARGMVPVGSMFKEDLKWAESSKA